MSYFNLNRKVGEIKKRLNESDDFAFRIFDKGMQKIALIYLKSIIDGQLLSEAIYEPLQNFEGDFSVDILINQVIKCADVKIIEEEKIIEEILDGRVILLSNFSKEVIAIDVLSFPERVPSEPPTSPVLQGPREGFVEDVQTNITLIRRRLKTENLVIKTIKIGDESNTKVIVTYLKNIANDKIVEKVWKNLKKIKTDGIIDSYYVLSYLEEHPNSMFKQIGNAEKPDIVVAKMLEGKVAILVDNSPIVLTVPFVIFEDMQNSNDYYTNYHYSSFIRLIRLLGVFISVIVPGFYLSLQIHHYNILPLNFLITIADTTQGLPFTPFLEIVFIFLLFQILYEVSLRLPSYLGLATSVVGALILGETGVKAGLISPPGVIIVALSKIALYTIPEQSSQITLLQLIFLILGGSLGLVGIVGGMVYFINYMNTLDSYETPYLAPYAPRIKKDLKDGLLTSPVTEMNERPKSFSPKKKERSDD